MKQNISLITKITIVFIFTFLLLIFAMFTFDKISYQKSHEKVLQYHKQVSHYLAKSRLNENEAISYLLQKDFTIVKNPHKILNNLGKHIIREKGFETIDFEKRYYIHILAPHFRVLLKDELNRYESSYTHFIVFGVVMVLFIFIYYLIIQNIKNTNLLLNSRQLFLRTIMHELKTPIAKGRIVSELIDDEKQKNRMVTIFEKLDFLINDFAKIEQVTSKNYNIIKQNYPIDQIVKNSIDMIMLENNKDKIVLKNIPNHKIKIDKDTFAMAIKNLIDNGLKYSDDNKITIEYKNSSLLFISKGAKLPRKLEEYFKPFHNDTISKNHGMGLGLYLVNEIVKLHNFKFSYENKDELNIFKIST